MKVEIWSDFTCPFCYIGKRKFDLALEKFENKHHVKIEYKSYQLDPNAMAEKRESVSSFLMKKYQLTAEKVEEMINQVCDQAEQVGLAFRFDQMTHTNTLHAHRLVKYAEKFGKEVALIDLLFQKYFIHNENIGERTVLLRLAEEVDLNSAEVDELLSLNSYEKAVGLDEELAREIGVNSVPFFVFNEKYALSGAQPTDVFLSAMEQLWEEEKDKFNYQHVTGKGTKTTYCEGADCNSKRR